jgi:hypothetical protein
MGSGISRFGFDFRHFDIRGTFFDLRFSVRSRYFHQAFSPTRTNFIRISTDCIHLRLVSRRTAWHGVRILAHTKWLDKRICTHFFDTFPPVVILRTHVFVFIHLPFSFSFLVSYFNLSGHEAVICVWIVRLRLLWVTDWVVWRKGAGVSGGYDGSFFFDVDFVFDFFSCSFFLLNEEMSDEESGLRCVAWLDDYCAGGSDGSEVGEGGGCSR